MSSIIIVIFNTLTFPLILCYINIVQTKNENRKILFLNLPHPEQITRRYMCSYYSAISLFPPYELLSLASVAREADMEPQLIDSIAEKKTISSIIKDIETLKPVMIVTITGFESFQEDVDHIRIIKNCFPGTHVCITGYYPTLFPEQTLRHSFADSVLIGEPELNFGYMLKKNPPGDPSQPVKGIAYRKKNGTVIKTAESRRIADINRLPLPAHDLLKIEHYYEPLMPGPFGVIQTSRGCPFRCSFCVKTYGPGLTEKDPENIIKEIEILVQNFNIRSFRFLDDTFTINRHRALTICRLITDKGLNRLKWSCLSRTDTVDKELLYWLRKAGCRRLYFGI